MPFPHGLSNQVKIKSDTTVETPYGGGILHTQTIVKEWLVLPEHYESQLDAIAQKKAVLEAEETKVRSEMANIEPMPESEPEEPPAEEP